VELYGNAIKEYEAALDLRPGFNDIRLKLARAYMAIGKIDLAEMHCRTCLNSRPDDTNARVFLGSVLLAQGRKTQAIDAWKQVLTLDPQHEDATRLYLIANGKIAEAP
jgi:tetratricopeptide (TPR) repeat protein